VPPSVSVIIVNYNAGDYLPRCIESLKLQSRKDFEVILVDNASTDNSLSMAEREIAEDSRFTTFRMAENIGFAAGNNWGSEHATGPWIATLNPDAFPEPDWLESLLAATEHTPGVAMFGSMQLNAANPSALDGAGDRYFAAGVPWRDQNSTRIQAAQRANVNSYKTFSPCGAAALYCATAYRAAGGFDETFFCFVEDIDLGFRLRLRGHVCRQVVAAKVLHVGGGAGGGESDFARYHGTRNLIWCFFKNMPLPLLIVLGPAHLLVLLMLLFKATLRGQSRKTLHAIWDGFAGLGAIWRARADTPRTAKFGQIISALDWSPIGYLRHRYRGS
jgi:GT2 family glycosyltransferase